MIGGTSLTTQSLDHMQGLQLKNRNQSSHLLQTLASDHDKHADERSSGMDFNGGMPKFGESRLL
jgi:hypothetical protein